MNGRLWMHQLMLIFLLIGLTESAALASQEDQFKNKVNLALRQTGHYLLQEKNDSSSTIPPVQYEAGSGFLLPLRTTFNYDLLPELLAKAFEDYDINKPYEVLVLNCEEGIPFLGYNEGDVIRGNVPCGGRDQSATCSNIFVQFSDQEMASAANFSFISWLLIPLAIGLAFFFYRKSKAKSEATNTNGRLALGQYYYDPKNQLLIKGGEKLTLTFRENKLLHLLASQPNQVLTRDQILAVVWGEEGVIVGRSLDVFISRLRKLLKGDNNVQIKNVHGVGYRLELP